MVYQVEDNDDLDVTGRILDVLRDARDIYATGNRSEGWWDGAIDYILNGEVRNPEAPPSDECLHWKFPGAECRHDKAIDLVLPGQPHEHNFDRMHGFCRCGHLRSIASE